MVSGLYFKGSQNETRIAEGDAEALRFLALPKLNRRLFSYGHLFSSAVQLTISMIGTELPSPATSIRNLLPSRVTS